MIDPAKPLQLSSGVAVTLLRYDDGNETVLVTLPPGTRPYPGGDIRSRLPMSAWYRLSDGSLVTSGIHDHFRLENKPAGAANVLKRTRTIHV